MSMPSMRQSRMIRTRTASGSCRRSSRHATGRISTSTMTATTGVPLRRSPARSRMTRFRARSMPMKWEPFWASSTMRFRICRATAFTTRCPASTSRPDTFRNWTRRWRRRPARHGSMRRRSRITYWCFWRSVVTGAP